jgi:hypothetical protein
LSRIARRGEKTRFAGPMPPTAWAPRRFGAAHAIAIRTHDSGARQDFRTAYDTLTYEITNVPAELAHSCHAYLKALGLELGVFDFAVTGDGAWWFLECGPGSQWAWLEEETGAPIAEAIADTLIGEPA